MLLKSLKYMFVEYSQNMAQIFSIAKKHVHQQTLRTSLGLGWVVIRDIIYFSVFVLFRFLMSGSGTVDGMNFVLFMLLGMIPWNFMSEVVNAGVMAIKSNKPVLSSIKFPIIILPTAEVIAIFMKRSFTLVIMIVVVTVFGDISDITWWMLIYYFFAMFIFMIVWNLIFTSLVAISNDFEQLYRSLASVMFYTVPVVWSLEAVAPYQLVRRLFKANPFVYIIEGFRDACQSATLPSFEYTICFWGICIFMLCIGSMLQYKLRRHYIDLI